MKIFGQGDRVSTPHGVGTVIFRRMAAPDYTEVATYSVKLDCKNERKYTGSVYPAKDIKEHETSQGTNQESVCVGR